MPERRQQVLRDALVLRDGAGHDRVADEQDDRERSKPAATHERANPAEVREHERRHRPARHERDGDHEQWLRGMSGELLERKRVRELRTDVEGGHVAQQIQPTHPAGEDDRREEPRRSRARRPGRRSAMRAALLAGCAAWLAVGVYGVVAYGHGYYRYRGFAPPADPHGVRAGTLLQEHFWSPAMHQRRSYLIYLPPGYAAAARRGARFPVLYLLHGSPGGGDLFINAGGVGTALDELVAHRVVGPYLIVMPSGSDGTFTSDTEWADTPHGRYATLVLDAVRAVDARWSTRPDRLHRAVAGNSEGGYGALNISLHHLGLFSLAESWSGYYVQQRSGPFAQASAAAVAANSPGLFLPSLAPVLHRTPFAVAVLTSWKDRALAARRFVAALRRSGAEAQLTVTSGGHTWELWRRNAPAMLAFAGRWFDAPRGARPRGRRRPPAQLRRAATHRRR